MTKRQAWLLLVICTFGFLTACASEKKSLGDALQTSDLVFNGSPEKAPDKINVYTAMACAAKYNADTSAKNLLKKIYEDKETPQQIVQAILSSGQERDKLYNAAKAMDFADLYAMSILTDNPNYIENTLYAKSAQNLTLAAIKLHYEEIFANQQLKQLDRLLSSQNKILNNLNSKLERNGDLTEPELTYKKNLETAINRLYELKSTLQTSEAEYRRLLLLNDTPKSEGKRFYELDDFDKRYNPEIFQNTAVSNRREFTLAKEKLGSFNASRARRQVYIDYPPVSRLDINGLAIDDNRYETALYNKTARVTDNLLQAIENYRRNPSKESLKQTAFDELAALVITQVELGYRLVEKANFDYEVNRYKITELKDTIRNFEKKKNLSDYEKSDLLNKRIELHSTEEAEAQIVAERATALRNLYYLAGLNPFSKNMLTHNLAQIEKTLKQAFNQDIITMLSSVTEESTWNDGGNSWAHKDKWLEELIDKPSTTSHPSSTLPKPKSEPTSKPAIKSYHSMLQLGSYTNPTNAVKHQKQLQVAFPQLNDNIFSIEEAEIDGTIYYRLIVKPEVSQLKPLCQEIVNSGFDCIYK